MQSSWPLELIFLNNISKGQNIALIQRIRMMCPVLVNGQCWSLCDAKILKALKSKNRYDDGCHIRSETPKLDIISIPRDTRTIIRGYKSQDKINPCACLRWNRAFYENRKGSLWEYRFIITLELDIMHLEKIVDDLGGVEIYVPMDMKYSDPIQIQFLENQS